MTPLGPGGKPGFVTTAFAAFEPAMPSSAAPTSANARGDAFRIFTFPLPRLDWFGELSNERVTTKFLWLRVLFAIVASQSGSGSNASARRPVDAFRTAP